MTALPTPRHLRPRPSHCLLVAAIALAAGAHAAKPVPTGITQAQARYQQERAVCLSGQSQQDRATCLKEAGAALAEARRGGLDDDASRYADNQRQRCLRLTGDDQHDCLARMNGRGTVDGSVAGGGLLRELVTREVVVPSQPAASAPASPGSR